MQSVLVTIDCHEWYAPPQIYTRDDITGLWTVKPALPPESPLLSSVMNVEQGLANNTVPLDTDLASLLEHMHQENNQELIDGVSSMETSSEHVTEGPNSRDDLDIGTKKRRVEEDSSADSIVVANCSLDEPREEKLEDLTNSENALLRDYQGAAAVAANASVAERVIEPTLVMLEVCY